MSVYKAWSYFCFVAAKWPKGCQQYVWNVIYLVHFWAIFFVALHIPQLGVIYLKITKAVPPSCTVILLNRNFVIKGSVSLCIVASVPFPPQCLFVLNNLNWFGWRFGEVLFILVVCSQWLCSFARAPESCGVFCDISCFNSIWPAFLNLIFQMISSVCVFQ